jgi:hypothetical protein
MKQIGIALASLVLTQCKGGGDRGSDLTVTCYTVEPDMLTPDPIYTAQIGQQTGILTDAVQSGDVDPNTARQVQAALARERLRACWLQFEGLAQRAEVDPDGAEGERLALVDEHRAVLDELVTLDEVTAEVAEHVQVAFEAAAYHVWRANAPISCYEPVEMNYKPLSSDRMTQQAAILTEMAEDGALEKDVVAQARAAIEWDIAFLCLSDAQVGELFQKAHDAGGGDYPTFEELALEVSPEAAQAAQFLVALLLEEH